jgi:hypothetical protein
MQRLFWRVSPRDSTITARDFVDAEEYDGVLVGMPRG